MGSLRQKAQYPNENYYNSFAFEVVIRQRLSLKYVKVATATIFYHNKYM